MCSLALMGRTGQGGVERCAALAERNKVYMMARPSTAPETRARYQRRVYLLRKEKVESSSVH